MSAARTASERRAAGDDPFCDCTECVRAARADLRDLFVTRTWPISLTRFDQRRLGALLRALVIQTLLDPATYARPAGWRP